MTAVPAPGSTMPDLTYAEALRGARGARPLRHPARAGTDPGDAAGAGRSAARSSAARSSAGHQRQGQRARALLERPPGGRTCGSGETPKPHLVTYRERLQVGRPADPAGRLRRGSSAEVLPVADRVARRLGPPTEFELLTARRLPLVRGGRRGRGPRGGRVSAAASTPPTPGTAASPSSPTSTSTTWTGSGRRSPTSRARRPPSSSAATSP